MAKKLNSWMKHLALFWRGPNGKKSGISYRQAMSAAKKTYKKKAQK